MEGIFTREQLMMMLQERIEWVADVLDVKTTSIGKITGLGEDHWMFEFVQKTERRKTVMKAREYKEKQYISAIKKLDKRRTELLSKM